MLRMIDLNYPVSSQLDRDCHISRMMDLLRHLSSMMDRHCHIPPQLDDGALSLDDSIAMARQAYEDGIEAVCATPHIRHDHDVHIPEIATRVAKLQLALEGQGIAVRIFPGGELAQTAAEGLTPEELQAVSLGGAGGWVLLEPASGPLGKGLCEVVERLPRP